MRHAARSCEARLTQCAAYPNKRHLGSWWRQGRLKPGEPVYGLHRQGHGDVSSRLFLNIKVGALDIIPRKTISHRPVLWPFFSVRPTLLGHRGHHILGFSCLRLTLLLSDGIQHGSLMRMWTPCSNNRHLTCA